MSTLDILSLPLHILNAVSTVPTASSTYRSQDLLKRLEVPGDNLALQVTGVGTGTWSATVTLAGTSDDLAWITTDITVSNTTPSVNQVFAPTMTKYKATLTALTGTVVVSATLSG